METDYPQLNDGFGNSLRMDENGIVITSIPGKNINLVPGAGAVQINGVALPAASIAPVITEQFLITAAEIKSLATAKILVPRKGAGTIIFMLGATVFFKPGATPYTVDPSTQFALFCGGFLLSAFTENGFLDQATPQVGVATGVTGADFASFFVDNDFNISSLNGPDATLGDGTMLVTLTYQVMPNNL